MLYAAEIHSLLAGRWPSVLMHLGIAEKFLRNKHGPCPNCGGKDRFRFDDLGGRGTWICNGCGAGDAFNLLQRVHGWDFRETRRRILEVAGLSDGGRGTVPSPPTMAVLRPPLPAAPTGRVQNLLRTTTTPDDVGDVIDYLRGRALWPVPSGCTLRAHASWEYWDRREDETPYVVGRYPALVAALHDVLGELVTAHVTYLERGAKLQGRESRKILSKLSGRRGCAVQLFPLVGNELGIAEGIETALAAHMLHGIPVWAATNATLLAKFEPPPSAHRVVIFADRDVAGLQAAIELHERLDGRASIETRTPPEPAKDWNDVLTGRGAR